jgi:hypothetical protein
MKPKTNIVAVAAILITIAVPSIASSQAMFLPSSHHWIPTETTNLPADAPDFGSTRHSQLDTVRPYGQW